MLAVLQARNAAPVLSELAASLPMVVLAAPAAALGGLRISREFAPPGLLGDVSAVAGVGLLGGGAYLVVSLLLRSPELERAWQLARAMLARGAVHGP